MHVGFGARQELENRDGMSAYLFIEGEAASPARIDFQEKCSWEGSGLNAEPGMSGFDDRTSNLRPRRT